MTETLLQLSFAFDFLPAWFSTALVSVGVAVAVSVIVSSGVENAWAVRIALVSVGLGSLSFVYGISHVDARPMMIGIVVVGRYVEGLTLLRAFQKLLYVLRQRTLPSSASSVVGLEGKIRYLLLALFALVLGVWVTIFAVVWGPLETTFGTALRFYWTLVTVIVSGIGLWVKLGGIEQTGLASGVKLGGILIVVGAEIYNLQALELDVLVYVAGLFAYTVGYWVAAIRFWAAVGAVARTSNRESSGYLSELADDEGVFEGLPTGFVLGMIVVSLVASLGAFYVVGTAAVCTPPALPASLCRLLP